MKFIIFVLLAAAASSALGWTRMPGHPPTPKWRPPTRPTTVVPRRPRTRATNPAVLRFREARARTRRRTR